MASAVLAAEAELIDVMSDRPPEATEPAKFAAVVETVSPSLAPTWNVNPVAPKTFLPLNCVDVVIDPISVEIW